MTQKVRVRGLLRSEARRPLVWFVERVPVSVSKDSKPIEKVVRIDPVKREVPIKRNPSYSRAA